MLSSAMFTLLVITASRRILSNIGSVQRIENREPISQHVMEEMMEAYTALRGRRFQRYRSRMLLTIAEAVTERLYGRSSARSVDAEHRAFANHSREPWVPAVSPVLPRSDDVPQDRLQLLSQDPLASPHS